MIKSHRNVNVKRVYLPRCKRFIRPRFMIKCIEMFLDFFSARKDSDIIDQKKKRKDQI